MSIRIVQTGLKTQVVQGYLLEFYRQIKKGSRW